MQLPIIILHKINSNHIQFQIKTLLSINKLHKGIDELHKVDLNCIQFQAKT